MSRMEEVEQRMLTSAPDVKDWFNEVNAHGSSGVSMILMGNKCDNDQDREVSKEEGQALADELGLPFLEVSAMAAINVEKAFFTVATDIKKRNMDAARTQQAAGGVNVNGGEKEKEGKCC